MERNMKTVLFLAACGLTLLMFLPLIIGWGFQLAIVFAMFLLMFYSHKKHPGKKVGDFYRDLWTFMANFPYFRPWAFYTALVGSPFDWPNYKSVPASEIAYFRRAVALHMRIWIVARYVSIWIVSIIVPLWGSVLWAVSRYPSRTVVHPPSKVSELGISTVIKLESNSKEKGPERWLFVNGIGLDHELAKLNALHLSAIFNKNIELIYKPTNGLLYDICNILGYRTFNAPNCTELALSVALHETLLDNQVNKVVLIAHSRGTLVASSTVRKIIEEGTTQLRKAIESKLEIYNFANCADVFATVTNRPYYENFVNKEDFLANLCSSTEPRVERLQPGKDTTSPKIFYNKNPGKGGHLLGAHYLPDFVAGLYMGPSEETTTSRLFNYLHKP